MNNYILKQTGLALVLIKNKGNFGIFKNKERITLCSMSTVKRVNY